MATHARGSNLDALRAAKEQGSRGNFKFWKPIKNGNYTLRFLPPNSDNGLFYKETMQHRVGDNYYWCPKAEKKPCPICEFYKKLYDIGTEESIALAKEIKPRKQYLYNVIVRDELGVATDNDNVQVYVSGKILWETLMDYFFEPDYGDLTSADSGFDFVVKKEKGEYGFPTYKNSKPRREPSPLADSEDAIEGILSKLKDLDAEIDYNTYDELEVSLKRFISKEKAGASKFYDGDLSDVASAPATEAPASTPAAASTPAPAKADDADDDFEAGLLAQLED